MLPGATPLHHHRDAHRVPDGMAPHVHDALLRLADLTEYYELGTPPLRPSLTAFIAAGQLHRRAKWPTVLQHLVRVRLAQVGVWLRTPSLPHEYSGRTMLRGAERVLEDRAWRATRRTHKRRACVCLAELRPWLGTQQSPSL